MGPLRLIGTIVSEKCAIHAQAPMLPFAMLKERNEDKEAEIAERNALILSMKEDKMSNQQIADALGYKDRSTISKILKQLDA